MDEEESEGSVVRPHFLDDEGVFTNPDIDIPRPSVLDFAGFFWQFGSRILNSLCMNRRMTTSNPLPDFQELPISVPQYCTREELASLPPPLRHLQLTWIGHASFVIQIPLANRSVTILTDPILTERSSMVQWIGPKRIRPVPITDDGLTFPPVVDIVVISHNHYDHLSHPTVVDIAQRCNPLFIVPLGLAKWFRDGGVSQRVVELDWWESLEFSVDHPPLAEMTKEEQHDPQESDDDLPMVSVQFVPAQHWSNRTMLDRDTTLWGGYVFSYRCPHVPDTDRHVYFAGDTGYGPIFQQIGERYSDGIDLALIPIGAYDPRSIMQYHHVRPDEAVQVALDVNARFSVGMHWGTFLLTNEPIMDPPRLLAEDLEQRGLPEDFFVVVTHGETNQIEFDSETTRMIVRKERILGELGETRFD